MMKIYRKFSLHLKENWIRYGFETFVVVVGILGAFALNNWNESRKNKLIEVQILNDLNNSLKTDSIQLVKINLDLESSLNAQKDIHNMDYQQLIAVHSPDSLLTEYLRGSYSFFPKEGVYQLLLKNNQLDLIRSDMLKASLVELYDFSYPRYNNIDAIVDDKFQYAFTHVSSGKIKNLNEGLKSLGFNNEFDKGLFKKYYEELREINRNLSGMTYAAFINIKNIQEMVNSILEEIQVQLRM